MVQFVNKWTEEDASTAQLFPILSFFYDQLSSLAMRLAFTEKTALQEYQKFISHRKHTEIIWAPNTQETGLNIEH